MLCAKDELGLEKIIPGLLELDAAIEAGTPFVDIWGAPETVIGGDNPQSTGLPIYGGGSPRARRTKRSIRSVA